MSSQFAKKMQLKTYESHVKRLQSVTCAVDSKKPVNKKPSSTKMIIQRRLRDEAINQENRHMLDRLAKVMQTKRIDNDGGQHIRDRKSQVAIARKHQLHRITQENQRLLQRIQQVNPVIDHVEFEVRAKKNRYLLRQLSDFKEDTLPPQIESWLLQKNKQLQVESIEKINTLGDREVYRGDIAKVTRTSALRRTQSARLTSPSSRYTEGGGSNQDA